MTTCTYDGCGWTLRHGPGYVGETKYDTNPSLLGETGWTIADVIAASARKALEIHNGLMEEAIRAHLDEYHEGWTVEEVQANYDRFVQIREIRRIFGYGAEDMFRSN